MASPDKTSVRDEVSRLTADFDRLGSEGKLSSESQAIMNSLFMIVELIPAIFLERNTRKDSSNSSKPSSQTSKDESALSHPGSNGKGKSENKDQTSNTRVNETVTISQVLACGVCAQDLSGVPCIDLERRTRIDIVFEKVIDHVDAEIKHCPACGATVKGVFPPNRHGPLQYGDGLKAFVINLLIGQIVALNRVQKLVKSMIGVVIAEAGLLKFVLRLHQALASWEQQATGKILNSPAINVDETSFRVDMKNDWIHVYSSNDITLKFLHRNRGKAAIEEINIIARYGGAIIHDCWPSYVSYPDCSHGLCGSHLLRELTFIVDTHNYARARNMKRLLQEACKEVSKSTEKRLSDQAFTHLQKRYRNILTRAEKELPISLPKLHGKRGKLAESDAHNLWERLKNHEAAVLLFAKNPHVSFTNNRAERDLRMSKVKQKVSGCFRVSNYAHAYCRISSYLQSMANKGYNPLIAIQIALAGEAHKVWGE